MQDLRKRERLMKEINVGEVFGGSGLTSQPVRLKYAAGWM